MTNAPVHGHDAIAIGAVAKPVRTWLRLEGAAVLVVAVVLYARGDHSWGLFALLFLAPDLGFAGYLAGPRIGAIVYNALHSYVGPLALAIGMHARSASL